MGTVKEREKKDSGMSEGTGPDSRQGQWDQEEVCVLQRRRRKEKHVPEEEAAGRRA